MRLRGLTVLSAVVLVLVAGCGGGDDSPDTGTTGVTDLNGRTGTTSGDVTPQLPAKNTLSTDEITEINAVSEKLEEAAKTGDGKTICSLFDPAVIKKTFKKESACVAGVTESSKEGTFTDLQVERIGGKGNVAVVRYKGDNPKALVFVKKDGSWYLATGS